MKRSKARKKLLYLGGVYALFLLIYFKTPLYDLAQQNNLVAYGLLAFIFAILLIGFYFSLIINSLAKRKGWNAEQKERVKRRQGYVCNRCGEEPRRWEFHHKDGMRDNNSLSNCEGLCPNCHAEITYRK